MFNINVRPLRAEELLEEKAGSLSAKGVYQLMLAAYEDQEKAEDAMLEIVEQEMREGKRPSL